MSQSHTTKIRAATAAEVCGNFELKADVRPLLSANQTPREFLDTLLARDKNAAAIEFLAHALPPREAIWWGCLCLQHAKGSSVSPPETAAEKAAVQWVLDPSEENRRAAKPAGDSAGVTTPGGCLAMATAWTGGSLAPPIPQPHAKAPPIPPVPPDPFLPAKAVAGAVMLAAVRSEPARFVDMQRRFVGLGIGVAEGRFVWPETKRASKKVGVERTWKRRISRV
jgi:hypothetical protein